MTKHSRTLSVVSTLALSLSAFATQSAFASQDTIPTTRVLNGEPVPECGFAPVAYTGNCSATLVHPEIILHAQHCGKPRSISLTHGGGGGKKLDVDYCKTFPGSWDTAKDFAFCKLKTPVTDIPPIPVAFGCEVDLIKAGADIVHCGFGANGGGGIGTKGFGTKRWGANTLGKVEKKGEYANLHTSPSKIVSCSGDSGGPLLMRMEDDTWRVIGVASIIQGNCSGSSSYNVYSLTAPGVEWIEKESGVDITPCFDPDGTWNPTKDCGKFYMGDHEGHGSWENSCEGTPVSGYSSTCGDPFGDDEGSGSGDEPSEGTGNEPSSGSESEEPEPSTTPDDEEEEDSGAGGDGSEDGDTSEDNQDESEVGSDDGGASSEKGSSEKPSDSSTGDEKVDAKGCSLGSSQRYGGMFALSLLLLGRLGRRGRLRA